MNKVIQTIKSQLRLVELDLAKEKSMTVQQAQQKGFQQPLYMFIFMTVKSLNC